MSIGLVEHDPNSTWPYPVDWTPILNQYDPPATIVGHSILAEAGITVVSSSHATDSITAVLTGGTPGQIYDITYRATLDQGPPYTTDRTVRVYVKNL